MPAVIRLACQLLLGRKGDGTVYVYAQHKGSPSGLQILKLAENRCCPAVLVPRKPLQGAGKETHHCLAPPLHAELHPLLHDNAHPDHGRRPHGQNTAPSAIARTGCQWMVGVSTTLFALSGIAVSGIALSCSIALHSPDRFSSTPAPPALLTCLLPPMALHTHLLMPLLRPA
jgi:hypothetical protein